MSNKTLVVYHSADFDGVFCREVARHFLGSGPNIKYEGWDFGDSPLGYPDDYEAVYVMDLPVDRVFELESVEGGFSIIPDRIKETVIWIDHHNTSIKTHPSTLRGYRIDGVAASRLAFQWFNLSRITHAEGLPTKQDFIDRKVVEPLAVRLVGEYDIWDKRDPYAELFQHGLRSQVITSEDFYRLIVGDDHSLVHRLLTNGGVIQFARQKDNASIIRKNGFTLIWEGIRFLACNAGNYNSFLFTDGLKPEHEALFGFCYIGSKKTWSVSLYHAPSHEDLDLSVIAKKFGGGGHKGACGFLADSKLIESIISQ